MEDAERFRLLGKYKTPRFRIGRTVFCAMRGEMVIMGMTDAPIPWTIGRHGAGRCSLVVFKDLAKASAANQIKPSPIGGTSMFRP